MTIYTLFGHVVWIEWALANVTAQILWTQSTGKEGNEAEGEPVVPLEHCCRTVTTTVVTKEGLVQEGNQLRRSLLTTRKGSTTANNDDWNAAVTHLFESRKGG